MAHGVMEGHAAAGHPDFYRLLQVDPDAPHELIVEAYWHLVRGLQDGRKDTPGLRDRLDDLNDAYATLISLDRRRAYDATLPRVTMLRREQARPAGTAGGYSPVSLVSRKQRSHRPRHRPDYYTILGVDPSAEPAIIDRAHSVLRVLQANDVGDPEELVEAYAVLADPARRAMYDASLLARAESEIPRPPDASSLKTVTAAPSLALPAGEMLGRVYKAAAAASHAAARRVWRGLAYAARLSRSFIVWAWPIARARSGQFAAWAWPIVRSWSQLAAARAWLVTKALAEGGARLARAAARRAVAWCRERRASTEPMQDWEVRSRLSRGLAWGPGSGSPGEHEPPAVALQPAARLIVESGPQPGAILDLLGEPVTLGVGEGCALPLVGDSARVESEHARIWPRQGRFIIRQLGGQPQVLVNGRAMPWAVLEDGDRIEIGAHVLRFQVAGPGRRPSRPGTLARRRQEIEGSGT